MKEAMQKSAGPVQRRANAAISTAQHENDLAQSPRMVMQRKAMGDGFGGASAPSGGGSGRLPRNLTRGIAALSGMDVSDVSVFRNSSRPAQFKALAFTQDNAIHLGPGQEKHLPHEAWHIVQQRQGRVSADVQAKGGSLNTDPKLEREADIKGAEAASLGSTMPMAFVSTDPGRRASAANGGVIQLEGDEQEQDKPTNEVADELGTNDKLKLFMFDDGDENEEKVELFVFDDFDDEEGLPKENNAIAPQTIQAPSNEDKPVRNSPNAGGPQLHMASHLAAKSADDFPIAEDVEEWSSSAKHRDIVNNLKNKTNTPNAIHAPSSNDKLHGLFLNQVVDPDAFVSAQRRNDAATAFNQAMQLLGHARLDDIKTVRNLLNQAIGEYQHERYVRWRDHVQVIWDRIQAFRQTLKANVNDDAAVSNALEAIRTAPKCPSQLAPYARREWRKMRWSKLSAVERKILKYWDRGNALWDVGDYARAGVQYERAHNYSEMHYIFNHIFTTAINAARCYARAGDEERAAKMYRKLGANHEALTWLNDHGKSLVPTYPIIKGVMPRYVNVARSNLTNYSHSRFALKESGAYLEEKTPLVDVAKNLEAALEMLLKKQALLTAVEKENTRMGTGLNLNELLIELVAHKVQNHYMSGHRGVLMLGDLGIRVTTDVLETRNQATWERLRAFKVQYLHSTAARNPYELVAVAGKLKQGNRSTSTSANYDTKTSCTGFSGLGWAIYVMDADGHIYANSHKVSQFHHSSFLAGSEAAAAGELRVNDGKLEVLTNKSGHYCPSKEQLAQAVHQFKCMGQQNFQVHVLINNVLETFPTENQFLTSMWPVVLPPPKPGALIPNFRVRRT